MLGGGDKTAMLKDRRIRIITVSEIRYEGNLYQVNSNDKTIALKDVIAFGTEDRPAAQVIPPSQTVYEVIIFRASHIKHLEVLSQEEQARATVQAQQGNISQATPNLEAQKPTAPYMPIPSMPLSNVPVQDATNAQIEKQTAIDDRKKTTANNRKKDENEEEPEYVPKKQFDDHQEDRGYNYKRGGDRDHDRGYNSSSGYGGKRAGYQKDRERYIPKEEGGKGVTLGERDSQGPRKDKGPKDFDFDEMVEKNNQLEKEKGVKEKEVEQNEVSAGAKYNFDDFFDNLSTSIGDKPEANGKDPYHLYKTNNETFGFQKKKFNTLGGRGGRGRGNYGGRGGRDGYRDHRDQDDDGYQQAGSHRGGSYRGDRGDRHYDRDRRERSPGQGDYRPKYNNDEGYSRGGRGRGKTSRGAGLPDSY